MKRAFAALAGLAILAHAPAVRAELIDQVEALLGGWQRSGAKAERVTTVFFSHGESRSLPIALRPSALRPCITVVAIAERGLSFTLERRAGAADLEPPDRPSGDGPDPDDEGPGQNQVVRESRAGVAELEHCSAADIPAAPEPTTSAFLAAPLRINLSAMESP